MNARLATVLLLCAGLGAARTTAAPFDGRAWEYRQSFETAAAGPLRVALPPALLDAARPDLADLRLLAADGTELAFAILQPDFTAAGPDVDLTVAPTRVGRTTVIEVDLDEPVATDRLTIESPAAPFVKAVTLAVADVAGNWQTVVENGVIFRTARGAENLGLTLAGRTVSRIRLTIDDQHDAPIPVTALRLTPAAAALPPVEEAPVAIRAIEDSGDETRLRLDFGSRHLFVDSLVVEASDPVFERPVRLVAREVANQEVTESTLAQATLRQLALPGGRRFTDTELRCRRVLPAARLELVIDNGDSPALHITAVRVRTRAVSAALAVPAPGRIDALAGQPSATAPRYDLAAFARDWAGVPPTPVRWSDLAPNPGFTPLQPPPEVPELAGPFAAEGWRHARAVKVLAAGAQVLELDPAVLAGTRPDLGDLRLVRGGRQVPYLLERSSQQRSIKLPLAPLPPAREATTVASWRLELPVAGLPVSRVSFEVAAPFFERDAILSEVVTDHRGEPWRRELGRAHWIRRGPDEPSRFSIPLRDRPVTRQLVLTIDHGDNTPFAPAGAEIRHPVRRLRFHATDRGELVLHYGHATASAPSYDLQLAAPRLLAAREQPAELAGAPAPVEREPAALREPALRLAFWGALAVAVVVLLVVVAKLLPKPPAGP